MAILYFNRMGILSVSDGGALLSNEKELTA
jgi:hypothetical protein